MCVCTENRTRSGLICHQKIHAPYELHTFLCRVLQVREETIVNPPESVSDTSSARFASPCPPRLTSVTWVYPLNTYPLDSKYAPLISVSTSDELHPESALKSVNVNVCFRFTVLVFVTSVQKSLLRQLLLRMHSYYPKRDASISKFPENPPHGKVALSQFKCSLKAYLY